MRAGLVLMVVASALVASCATAPGGEQLDAQLRERLVGQWQQRIDVLGEARTSQWSFSGDGSYQLTGYSETRGVRASYVPEHGAWTLAGGMLELRYLPAAEAGSPPPEAKTEVRRIVRLTDEEFVTADARFGIELAYRRAARQ